MCFINPRLYLQISADTLAECNESMGIKAIRDTNTVELATRGGRREDIGTEGEG